MYVIEEHCSNIELDIQQNFRKERRKRELKCKIQKGKKLNIFSIKVVIIFLHNRLYKLKEKNFYGLRNNFEDKVSSV